MKKLMAVLGLLVALLILIGGAVIVKQYRLKRKPRPIVFAAITPADHFAMARAACGGLTSLDDKKSITCSVCPAGSDFAGSAGMPGSSTGWTLDGVLPGQFTAANVDEALLHASGCEAHYRDFGGDFLMRRTAGKWSVVRYAPGATATDKCQEIKWQAGRDAVICETSHTGQGVTGDGVQLLLFDATAPPKDDFANTIFVAIEDETGNCGFQQPHDGPSGLMQFGKIDSVKILDGDGDGQDVTVEATIERAHIVPTKAGVCPAGRRRSYKIAFHNMGDHFEAGEGYQELAMQKRDDCCEMMINKTVRPGKY
jgi:hypothetical protein